MKEIFQISRVVVWGHKYLQWILIIDPKEEHILFTFNLN